MSDFVLSEIKNSGPVEDILLFFFNEIKFIIYTVFYLYVSPELLTGVGEPPNGCWERWTQDLDEQPVFLTAEP